MSDFDFDTNDEENEMQVLEKLNAAISELNSEEPKAGSSSASVPHDASTAAASVCSAFPSYGEYFKVETAGVECRRRLTVVQNVSENDQSERAQGRAVFKSKQITENVVPDRQNAHCQMNYPAPYSQTWADPQAVPTGVDKMKKSASFQANRNKSNDPTCNRCWQRPKPLTHGSNPYAPHLKYGLFPRKINPREPSHNLHKLPMGKKKSPTEEIHILMDKCKDQDNPYESMKERHHSDHRNVNLNDSNAPLFVIRPIDKRYTRQLSLSEVTHVDIKPQRSAPLPLLTSPRSPLGERMRRKNRVNTRY